VYENKLPYANPQQCDRSQAASQLYSAGNDQSFGNPNRSGKQGPHVQRYEPHGDDAVRATCTRRRSQRLFFKQAKQALKLSNFLGHSANAVRWQVYSALLTYVLLRFQAYLSNWGHSFTRLFTVTRSTLWERIDLLALLKSYGTATGRIRVLGALDQAWLPGFSNLRT